MRLRPVLDDEIDEPLWWMQSTEPRFRPTSDARLSDLRRSIYDAALAAIPSDRPVRVSTYVFADPGVDADATHLRLERHAHDRGWLVHRKRFTDAPARGPLPAHPQFNRACRHAGAGYVDGVLAVDRSAMPSTDEAYEAYLRWLQRHCAFLAFLQPTSGGAP
ncbi:hypothetical protein ABZ023_18245 [Streptomyces sp. NPDC006367]|uniref:hypothetical protein n=1 Tax=unclassified Streptomyces TaxID=2593676 RepID=UPI00339EE8DF